MPITDDMKNFKAFQAIRQARAYKRLHGMRYDLVFLNVQSWRIWMQYRLH